MASHDDTNDKCADPLHSNAAIDNLAKKVDGLLTGGLHGELYEGSRSSANNRHKQLAELFELRKEIGEIKATQEKNARTEKIKEEQAASATTKGGSLSASNVAAMEAVVHRLTADKFRDINVLSQREKDSEKENGVLRGKIEDLEFKLKMNSAAGPRDEKIGSSQKKRLEERIAKLESAHVQDFEEHRSASAAVKNRVDELVRKTEDLGGETKRTDEWIEEIRDVTNNRLERLEEEVNRNAGILATSVIALQDKIAANEEHNKNVQNWVDSWPGTASQSKMIKDLEEKLANAEQSENAAVKQAQDQATLRNRLIVTQKNLAQARWNVIVKAAKETPARSVKDAFDIAAQAKPPVNPTAGTSSAS